MTWGCNSSFLLLSRRRPAEAEGRLVPREVLHRDLLLLVSVGALFVQGLNLGLDFTGGALVEVGFEEPVDDKK